MRAAIGLRLLLALTLMGWGQFVFSADYSWTNSYSSQSAINFATPQLACDDYFSRYISQNSGSGPFSYVSTDYISVTQYRCTYTNKYGTQFAYVYRAGSACPSGSTYNSSTGVCDFPEDCSATSGKEVIKAQTCTYDVKLKTTICEDQVDVDGCLFTAGGKKNCVADLTTGKYICTGSFYGTGQAAGQGSEPCTTESCTPPRDPDVPPAEEQCVTNGVLTICHSHQEEGCGSINGKEGCFQEEPGCGYFNGTYQCVGADKPNRNCGYFNGVQTCFDPNDPTKAIPPTSPDHPSNGGNADGDDSNDPLPSGSTDSSPQGSNEGATNEALQGLGDKLGDKLDDGNSLLGDIANGIKELGEALGEFMDGVLGEEYDGSGSGEGEGIGDDAGEASQGLANSFGEALEGALIDQAVADESALDGFSDLISDPEIGWFGENSSAYYLVNLIDGVIPSARGCVPYAVRVQLNRYSFDVEIDPCILQSLQKLLEWIIWMLTIIGVWRIAYSTLRLENAKADKGGF